MIEHLKGLGWLRERMSRSTHQTITSVTYLIVPDEGSTSGVISTPFSTTLEISNTASDIAVDIQTDASARWRPVKIKRRQKMSWGSAPSFSLADLGRYCGPELVSVLFPDSNSMLTVYQTRSRSCEDRSQAPFLPWTRSGQG